MVRPLATAALTVLGTVALLATPVTVLAESQRNLSPPPIPDSSTRARFIAAEREGFDDARTLERARALHEEYDVTHYDISLSLDIPNTTIYGTIEVQATSQIASLSQITMDLIDELDIDAVTAGGLPAIYTHVNDDVLINLGSVYEPDEPFTVSCTYHGTPVFPGSPFRWLTQNGVPMVLSYSEPFGAPAWWMCKDDPSDKATYAIHLTVPDSLFAVSNGLLDSEVDNGNGTKTYNWVTGYPMSHYLFSIAVTNFATWSEVYTGLDAQTTMDIDYYAYPADLADAQISWGRNLEMMEYYASIFGEYPFIDEKYSIAEFQHSGAMEHQTCTSMGSGWVTPSNSSDWIVAHELAHSWVGDMITMTDWPHAWCKEGFATYCEALYFEDKFDEAFYHDYMDAMNIFTYANFTIYDMTPPLAGAIYFKGAWVLHMLRHVVGDQNFYDAIFAYTSDETFRYGVADTDDLRGVFEATSGMDLVWFFDQWVYSGGYPEYEYGWSFSSAPGGGFDVELELSQLQAGQIFKMPIDIRIETAGGPETFVVWDSLATQSFTLNVGSSPTNVIVDPDVWIIRDVQTVGVADGSPTAGVGLLSARPNPFRTGTSIRFHLDRAAPVQLDVYDAVGRWVTRLAEGLQPEGTGSVRWDGVDGGGRAVAPGVYYYRFRAVEEDRAGRVVLVR